MNTYHEMRKMLQELEFFATSNPEYLKQSEFEDELSNIYQELLEFKQRHLP
jgi:hypothetical protein